MEERFEKLNDLLINFSLGNFDYQIELSENLDDIDTIISGISMLGEELKSVTISKNFFNNIFNAATDMFFVLSEDGFVLNHNSSVLTKTGLNIKDIQNKSICELMNCSPVNLTSLIKDLRYSPLLEFETEMYGANGRMIPVLCSVTNLYPDREDNFNFLLNARDLTKIKEFELSIRASEEKYRRIFEESGDTIFLADKDGFLKEVNNAGKNLFNIDDNLSEISIFDFFINQEDKKAFIDTIRSTGFIHNMTIRMMEDDRILETIVSANIIQPDGGIQGVIHDITKEKEYEKLLLKTVVNTQELERQRFAKDLHDSLGQQLSAITFYINTIRQKENPEKEEVLAVLSKSNEALNAVISELRHICFNLMPRTLENRGLYFAIVELCKKMEFDKMLKFDLAVEDNLPELEKNLEITIYRIIQEFINNALKHGKAKNIRVEGFFNKRARKLEFKMSDDGNGFDTEKIKSGGMGLTNIKSRLQPYDGDFRYYSVIGEGTTYEIDVPVPY